jgi:hypothetical protein
MATASTPRRKLLDRTKVNINQVLNTPEGISEFLIYVQDPLQWIATHLQDVSEVTLDALGDGERECSECGQDRPLTQEERNKQRSYRDAADQLEYYARELEDCISKFSEFDPVWIKEATVE